MLIKNYKYNELEYAQLIYNNGFQTNYIPTELRLLVLYYKEVLKLKPKQRSEQLYEFCEKHMPDYKRAKYFKIINKALKQGSKKEQKLVNIEKINIFQSELDYINSLEIKYDFKKVLFTFLVQMKLNKFIYEYKNEKPYTSKYFKGGSIKYNNIKKMANLNNSININDDIIYFLNDIGLVKTLHKGLIVLNYLDNCSETGDIAIDIKDFENVGWYLDFYNGLKGMVLCKYCGQPFKQTNHDISYCKKHKQYYIPMETKTIVCQDCGKEISVDSLNTKTIRCEECQHKEDKRVKREYWRKTHSKN